MSGSPLSSETETDVSMTDGASGAGEAPSGSDFNADQMLGDLIDGGTGEGSAPAAADEGVFAGGEEDHDGSEEEAALAQGANLETEKPAPKAKPPGTDHAREAPKVPEAKPGEKKSRGPTREQLAALVAQDIQAQAALGPLGQAQARAQANPQQAAPATPAPTAQQTQQQANGPAPAAPLAFAPETIKALTAEYGDQIKPLLDNHNALASAFQQTQQQNQLLANVVTRILDERLIQEEAEFNETLDELRQQGYTDIYGTDNENMTPAQQRSLALLDQHVSGLRDRMMGARQRVGLADLVHSAHAGIFRERVQKQAAEAERKKLQGQVKQAHRRQDVLPGGGSGRPVARGATPTQHLESLVEAAISSRT